MRSTEIKRITVIGFAVNAILTGIKIIAGILGNSGAMIADGVHSLSDFLTDITVLIGVKLAEKPEDSCHNYGHEKYETLTTIIISLFLATVGWEILKTGIKNVYLVAQGYNLARPKIIALSAAFVSIVAKELLYRYTIVIGKKVNSSSLIANAWHHRSDAYSSIGSFFGIGGAMLLGDKWTILDPIASIVISIFIFKVAVEIFLPSINELLESSVTEEEREEIISIIEQYEEVKEYHKLRTRKNGTKTIIEFHLLVDSNHSIKSAHDIATGLENALKEQFGDGCIVTIHLEPFEVA